MSIDLKTLFAKLTETPPRCLRVASPLALLSQKLENTYTCFATAWSGRAHSDYIHSMVIGEPTWISSQPPMLILFGQIGLMCEDKTMALFYFVTHGFNNEIDVIDAGIEKPSPNQSLLKRRKSFECVRCTSKLFRLEVMIYYQAGTIEMLQSNIDLPFSDMFN